MWNCPICTAQNSTMLCTCGFDRSRDYASYPTWGQLPVDLPSAAGMMEDPEPRMAVVKCPKCGQEAVIREDQFFPTCEKCDTFLNPADQVKLYRSPLREILSGNVSVNPYSLYIVLTEVKGLFPYADPETARELSRTISTICDHPEDIGLTFPDDVRSLLALEANAFRWMLERGEFGKNIFDEWEKTNREQMNQRRVFLRSTGFRRYRGAWHFTPFNVEDYRRHTEQPLFRDAAAANAHGDYTLAQQRWEAAEKAGNPYAAAHLGMLYHYGRGCETNRALALECFVRGAGKGCPLSAAWITEYYRMGYTLEKDEYLSARLYGAVDPELQKMCQAGDAEAQYFRAYGLLRGIGIKEDKAEGIRLLQAAHAQGHISATVELASCYYFGDGVEVDYHMAFRLLNERACPGRKNAPYLLGLCYYWGHGTEQDYSQALQQFKRAAKLGHGTAKDYLGDCYSLGQGTGVNYAEAAKWYHDAADNHQIASAAHHLAFLYHDGQGVEQNEETAVRYWMLAAEGGIPQAQRIISGEYLTGKILKQDNQAAREWMEKAAKQGDAKAQYLLGCFYGSDDDMLAAIEWIQKAAEQGYAEAQFEIGKLSQRSGKLSEAVKWYRLAAEQGDYPAMYALALLYLDGNGVDRDPDQGMEYLTKAAEGGFHQAALELADRYYQGIPDYKGQSLYTNPSLAHKYAILSAENATDGKAQYRLGTIIHHALGNPTGAKDWYQRAIANGYDEARLELAKVLMELQTDLGTVWGLLQELGDSAEVLYLRSVCLENGWGCPRDKRKSKQFYAQAIQKGYVDTAKKKKWFGLF